MLGVSIDTRPALNAFVAGLGGLPFPVLSDFHPQGKAAKAFGVWNEERGTAIRSCFIVDKEGIVRWKKVYERGLPENDEILGELAKLPK